MQMLLSVREVVARTGLSERTVRQMIFDRRLRAIRLHGVRAIRVPMADVLALVQQAEVPLSMEGERS